MRPAVAFGDPSSCGHTASLRENLPYACHSAATSHVASCDLRMRRWMLLRRGALMEEPINVRGLTLSLSGRSIPAVHFGRA